MECEYRHIARGIGTYAQQYHGENQRNTDNGADQRRVHNQSYGFQQSGAIRNAEFHRDDKCARSSQHHDNVIA